MPLPDISTIKFWAFWDARKIPNYRIYEYRYYVPLPHDLYVFRERSTNIHFAQSLTQLTALFLSGSFKPFVLVNQRPQQALPPPPPTTPKVS